MAPIGGLGLSQELMEKSSRNLGSTSQDFKGPPFSMDAA